MFSEQAKNIARECRFCWMCRHLCPIGLQTGREVNSAHAKALLVDMAERGYPFDGDTARVMYECLLCGACTNDCVTGFDPLVYIREARTGVFVQGLVPPEVQRVYDNLIERGNIYGIPARERPDFGAHGREETLLYIGAACAFRAPAMARHALSLLEKAGVPCAALEEEPDTGAVLGDLMGYVEDVRRQAAACAEAVNTSGAKTVVVLDPADAVMMLHKFPEWGCPIEAEVCTATAFAARLVREGRLLPKPVALRATYQDASPHARELDEHEPARELIAALGISFTEMFLNRRLAKCGGNTLLNACMPALCQKTARGRWEDATRIGQANMLTACPQAFEVLSAYAPEGCRAIDLFALLDGAC